MSITLTTGFFPVAQLPAAQQVLVRVYVANLETEAASATVTVSRLTDGRKERLIQTEVEVPGEDSRLVELTSEQVEGQNIEVTVTLPTNGFGLGTGLRPAVAVVTRFIADDSISLLQWISANDFVAVPSNRMVNSFVDSVPSALPARASS